MIGLRLKCELYRTRSGIKEYNFKDLLEELDLFFKKVNLSLYIGWDPVSMPSDKAELKGIQDAQEWVNEDKISMAGKPDNKKADPYVIRARLKPVVQK